SLVFRSAGWITDMGQALTFTWLHIATRRSVEGVPNGRPKRVVSRSALRPAGPARLVQVPSPVIGAIERHPPRRRRIADESLDRLFQCSHFRFVGPARLRVTGSPASPLPPCTPSAVVRLRRPVCPASPGGHSELRLRAGLATSPRPFCFLQ